MGTSHFKLTAFPRLTNKNEHQDHIQISVLIEFLPYKNSLQNTLITNKSKQKCMLKDKTFKNCIELE